GGRTPRSRARGSHGRLDRPPGDAGAGARLGALGSGLDPQRTHRGGVARMTVVVFIGPSLSRVDALARFPGIVVDPPAARGDLYRAARSATPVVLVDGLFDSVRSVWHKEILWALAHGVRVLGASSMGALRAAECAAFGMEPIGVIAHDYLHGRRT